MTVAKIALLTHCTLMMPVTAWAQHSDAAEDQRAIAEIIVTANRVETSAQKTAVAVNVYSGTDLVSKGVTNVATLAAIDPSLNITTTAEASYLAIRGVASTDTTQVGDPSVPISRDGFFTNRQFSLLTSMYDVARIEVLKGPQGTLNGRNSTGGLVSIVTNKPVFTNGGYANLEAGAFDAFNAEAGINVAASDKLAFRASGIFRRHDGYRRITGINIRGDDEHVYSGRFQVAARPTDNVTLNLSYQHDKMNNVGSVAWKFSPIGTRPASFGSARSFPGDYPTLNKLTTDRIQWDARIDDIFGELTFVYAGGRDKTHYIHELDGTSPIYPAIRTYKNNEAPVTWNHEVRLSNDPASRFFFQFGYFHFLENNAIVNGFLNVAMTGPFAPGGPLAGLSTAGRYGVYFDNNIRTQSDALFGQVAYALNDQFKVSAGLRYTWDKKLRTGTNTTDVQAVASPFVPLLPNGSPIIIVSDAYGKYPSGSGKGQPSFHLGIDYTPTETTLIYAKYDRGYKAGGFNTSDSGIPVPDYAPEKIDSFEIGAKNRFLDNRLQFNVDAFYFTYDNYQGSQYTQTGSGASGVFNVGNAKVYGAEAQLTALFGEGGRFDLNSAFLHSKMGDGIVINDGGNPSTPHDVSGNRLPNAPKAVISAGLEYAFKISDATLTPRVDAKYSSKFYYSVFDNEDETSRPFTLVNASLTYAPQGRNWEVSAFVRNAFDKVIVANARRNYLAGASEYVFQPPRTWGVRGGVKF